ncbi:polysaccharide pyruvyl transferase family protein [Vibrio harveyi]
MSSNKAKNIVIKYCSQDVVKKLRKYRVLKERILFFLSYLGFRACEPYKLKYQKSCNYPLREIDSRDVNWGEAFCDYKEKEKETVRLVWADGPIPGNYGDWLSPYIINKVAKVNISHVSEAENCQYPHIVGLGSIASCANENSVVISAGITSQKIKLNPKAYYVSVRGKYTNQALINVGHKGVSVFGDIGFILRRLYQPNDTIKKYKYLLVRHIQHIDVPIVLNDDFEELSIYAAKPKDIERFIDKLHEAEIVVTSAMHCYITCLSYGIPCVLFKIGNSKNQVPGDGIKYLDALEGVGLKEIPPFNVDVSDLKNFPEVISSFPANNEKIEEDYLDKIENAIKFAVDKVKYK